MSILSPAERSFLHDLLVAVPPVRPDLRAPLQFRPLEALVGFLPLLNGSARLRLTDGSECIVLVKLRVVVLATTPLLVEVDVDVAGHRDDLNFAATLKHVLHTILEAHIPREWLQLTTKYAFKLFVDCVVVAHTLYPLTLVLMALYLALRLCRLPRLVLRRDDAEVEEQPTFSDDWAEAAPLIPVLLGAQPPLLLVVALAGNNVFVDPLFEELEVCDSAVVCGYVPGVGVVPPLTTVLVGQQGHGTRGLRPEAFPAVHLLVETCGKAVATALDAVEESGDLF